MHTSLGRALLTDLHFVDLFDFALLISHHLGEGVEHLTKLRLKGGVSMLTVPAVIKSIVTMVLTMWYITKENIPNQNVFS